MHVNRRKHTRSIAWKIIITCLLAGSTILLSLYVSRITFKKILYTVNQLSKPNIKIALVNDIFQDVVKLDQLQRNEDFKNIKKSTAIFEAKYDSVQHLLDSLRGMSLQNQAQVVRIDSVREMLLQKKTLFISFIEIRNNLARNDTLSKQVKKLSGLIEKAGKRMDSTLVTTSRKTEVTIDTLVNNEEEERQSLWKRIFRKKKKAPPAQVQKKVHEELKTRVDTMVVEQGGQSVAEMSKAISDAEQNSTYNRIIIADKQAAINKVSDVLLSQLINILDDIVAGEMQLAEQKNVGATRTVNKGIHGINLILLFFVLGTAVLIVMIFADIARSNAYRNQLIIAKEEAEQAGMVKQRFLANMSHELRTPLQAIIGIAEQVKLKKDATEREMENIYQSSQHLLQTVNEILDYSRIVSGRYTLDERPFRVMAVVDEVKEIIQVHATMKQLSLKCAADINEQQYYTGDAFRLKQMLLNLLGNAVKYTESGSVFFSVSAADDGNKTLFTFTIKDTGIGIAEGDIGNIFNEFEQVDNPYRQNGTGLGLNIVKTLTELQHGSIKVASKPGEGSVFTMQLPYTKADAPAVAAPEEVHLIPQQYNGHVWVVDDDPYILELCDSMLSRHNIAHTCFSTPQALLEQPVPKGLQTVFMDIRMPGMSGMELCERLKARITVNPPKLIALTAQVLPQEQQSMREKGFDELLLKPFVEESFIKAIRGHAYMQPQPTTTLRQDNLHKMTGGKPAQLNKARESFVRETAKDIAVLRSLGAGGDATAVAEPVHRLAGRCGQFGEKAMARKLRELELALRAGRAVNQEEIKGICSELEQIIASTGRK